MTWTQLQPDMFVWRDSCNVYAVIGPAGAIIVNAGTGAWLDARDTLPARPAAVVCTHFFRDHSAGAARAAERGIPVYVPEGERAIFADPAQHFRQRDTYIIYDNYWDLFAPIEATPISGVLLDYERRTLVGLDVEVVPLPGVTLHHTGLAVRSGGRQLVFCGEAIHSHGKVARVAPYQYNYNDLGGAVNAFWSARDLRKRAPDALLPSLGTPMFGAAVCESALAALEESLKVLCDGRPDERAAIASIHTPALQRVSEHVWRATQSQSYNWFVVSRSGKVLAIDYGYHNARGLLAAEYSKRYRRRALLHSLDALKAETGADKIDVALISHFHDDHVCGVPLLQRLHGTQSPLTGHDAANATHMRGDDCGVVVTRHSHDAGAAARIGRRVAPVHLPIGVGVLHLVVKQVADTIQHLAADEPRPYNLMAGRFSRCRQNVDFMGDGAVAVDALQQSIDVQSFQNVDGFAIGRMALKPVPIRRADVVPRVAKARFFVFIKQTGDVIVMRMRNHHMSDRFRAGAARLKLVDERRRWRVAVQPEIGVGVKCEARGVDQHRSSSRNDMHVLHRHGLWL